MSFLLAALAAVSEIPRLLAVLPFLPPGRGALILIFGGLMVLPVSLLMSRIGSRAGAGLQFVPVPADPAPPAHPTRTGHTGVAAHAGYRAMHAVPAPVPHAPPASHDGGHRSATSTAHGLAQRPPLAPALWGGTGLERALRVAVGATQLVSATPGHYVVRLQRCESCARRLAGCEAERSAIERAVAAYLPHPRVTERVCAQRERQSCTFDIRRG